MSFVKVLITAVILGCAAYILLVLLALNIIAIRNDIIALLVLGVLVAIIVLDSVFIVFFSGSDVTAGIA
jgi:hypothetical protein